MNLNPPSTSDAQPLQPTRSAVEEVACNSEPALDHIGIAVRDIALSRVFYETLGMKVSSIETVSSEGVQTAMLSLGESRIELLEPLTPESVVGRFLDRRGEGLHHIAIQVPDIRTCRDDLAQRGMRLVGDSIGSGAGGHAYFFVHPSSTGGVLVEIVGDAPPPPEARGQRRGQIEDSAREVVP